MRYLPTAPSEDRALLDAIGVERAEDLLVGIPESLRLQRELNLPGTRSEQEVLAQLQALAGRNTAFSARFLGAGAYDHFVPSAIDQMINRQEWFTAYTPYQPEISQGTLQHIFEYQTLMCDLTGLEVGNASLYDGGTACVEAALMAVRLQKKRKTILLSAGLHPHYQEVLCTNITPHEGLKLVVVELRDGVTDLEDLKAKLNGDVAAVMVGYPNFLGCVEDLQAIGELAHAARMGDDFDRARYGLSPIHIESLEGALYVCLADTPPPFEDFRSALAPLLAPHRLSEAKLAHEATLIEAANWKLVMENARECYHCARRHPELSRTFPVGASGHFDYGEDASLDRFNARMADLGLPVGPVEGEAWQAKGLARALVLDGLTARDAQGTLRPALAPWWPTSPGFHLYYPSRRQASPGTAWIAPTAGP